MVKIILFFMAIGLFFASGFTGCERDSNSVDDSVKSPTRLEISHDMSKKIMNCFINKDEETLYSLMSPEAKDFPLTKEQIQDALIFFDGEIISYDLPTRTGLINTYISSDIENVNTDSGNKYAISFQCFFKDFDYFAPTTDLDGISCIIIDWKYSDSDYIGYRERIGIGVEITGPNVVS